MEIQRPTLGRNVEYFDREGRGRVAFVQFYDEASKDARVNLQVLDGDRVRFETSVPHNGDGGVANTWRYPAREERKIRVER